MNANSEKRLALIIDDEKTIGEALAGVLEDENWQTAYASSGLEGLQKFAKKKPHLIFLDIWMPGMDGIETLQRLRELNSQVPIYIMSGHGTIETAVKVTKLGATDFLEKPLSIDRIVNILQSIKSFEEVHVVKKAPYSTIIGTSPHTESIRELVKMIAPRSSSILITGENGTGKEVLAQNIHHHSERARDIFVAVNCAAIPEELIESELFGHVKGAFTGAIASKKGKFELAHGGTLFLDEIADMSLRTQAKILRIIQEKKFERLGDENPVSVDVRLIAATNKDLTQEIAAGRFREDLFYRLNVVPIHMLPLKKRREDVMPLVEFFLEDLKKDLDGIKKEFSPAALQALKSYHFPGNVRELKNLVERLCVTVASPKIDLSHLPIEIISEYEKDVRHLEVSSPHSLKDAKLQFEKVFVLEKLQENNWNISRTAESIGVERSHLHRKIKLLGIDSQQLKEGEES